MKKNSSKTDLNLDTKFLSEFIYAFNIARRKALSYPAGHPANYTAADKLMLQVPKLFEFRSSITIGIARDTLLFEGQTLDSQNPIYRDVATKLFDAKIAALTIKNDVSTADFCIFFEVLCTNPEEIEKRGGIDTILDLEQIGKISVQTIDFRAFQATEVQAVHAPKSKIVEDETSVLWKSFVKGLIAGTLDPDGDKFTPDDEFDPELLAEIMNSNLGVGGNEYVRNYDDAIISFLKEADRSQLKSKANLDISAMLDRFVANLNPEQRRRFLNSSLKSCSSRLGDVTDVLSDLSHAQILQAMQQVDSDQLEIPQALMDVLGKLSQQEGSVTGGSRVAGKRERTIEETADQLGSLFSPDQADQFVPEDYQEALAVLNAAESLPGLERTQVSELINTLNHHTVEQNFCNIMIKLIHCGTDTMTTEAINLNMEDLILFFLDTGDFSSLISVYDQLTNQTKREEDSLFPALRVYAAEEFVEQVLDSLYTWGTSQRDGIKRLIQRVGIPFAKPLIIRLAEEPLMAKRRLYMECLQMIGTRAKDLIMEQLHDKRWYLVRNLIILLRKMDDPSILPSLSHLAHYGHPKVQFEAIRTFLHFRDPRADHFLLKKLNSDDPQVLHTIARLAAGSHSENVAVKLSELLDRKFPKKVDAKIKRVVIKSLGEMAYPATLPALERFLFSRSPLQFTSDNTLKIEALKALALYSDPAAAVLTQKVYQKYSGVLSRTAHQIHLKLSERVP